ncbi:hypothetical protein AGMMS49938_03550 [Fibrobacterales bacterium]|nr:hypothetical protein AGMMS49938_03550 [Fibrobacterales bacterium]
MDLGTATTATATTYEPPKAEKNDKTGKQEVPNYAPEEKEEGVSTPTDTLELSDAVKEKKDEDGSSSIVGNGFADFDMDAFQGEVRSTLLQSINQSKDELRAAGVEFVKFNEDTIKYDLGDLEDVKEADVPEYWNSENTSQRIVDFAMSFRSLAPELSDEEYINQVRGAAEKGFGLAKKDIGDLPGQSAKLFNNTYDKVLQKFDDLLAQAQQKKTENTVNDAVKNAIGNHY